jgi:hypothetical protein
MYVLHAVLFVDLMLLWWHGVSTPWEVLLLVPMSLLNFLYADAIRTDRDNYREACEDYRAVVEPLGRAKLQRLLANPPKTPGI